jgi:hypothetical protein
VSIERFAVQSVTPYRLSGTDLPGEFEQVQAVATVALDPDHPANGFVVDLSRARRDPDGLVRLDADVMLIRPADGRPTGLLFVVANRGLVTTLPFSRGVRAGAPPDGRIDPGDGFALRRGLSVAWVGWQWDVDRRPGVVGIEVPEALGAGGDPLRSQARLEFLPLMPQAHHRLADEVGPWMGPFRSLTAADLDEPQAALTVRDWFNGPREPIARSRWCFGRDVEGSPVPDAEHIWLEGGFQPRRYYEVTYTTGRCPIAGAGLAAVRDGVSYMRSTMGFDRVLSTGTSQSGRWLRQFIFETANTAEDGSPVFDGVFCHIAGGRRGEFNNRSAQPSTMNSLGFGYLPPFSPEGGLFAPARACGNAPRTIFANSATEYWRGDASLVHTDADGRDLPDGADWRAYMYAGVHHSAGMPEEFMAAFPVQLAANRVEVLAANRAHLVALDEWVTAGRPPPPSEVPRAADGSGWARADVLRDLAGRSRFAGTIWPDPQALLGVPPIDLGPEAKEGIGRYPAVVTGPPRPCLVAAVDEDGNETCGVRLPDVAVPLAASFGWNPEVPRPDPATPGATWPVELWSLLGGSVTFGTQEILDRYRDRDGYLEQVQDCVADLVARRHLLDEDAGHVIDHARALWERAMAPDKKVS